MQRGFGVGGGGDHNQTAGPPSSSSSGDVFNNHQPNYADQSFYDPNPYNYHHHNHHYGHFNGGGGGAGFGFGSGHHSHFHGRKRGWHNSNQENVNYAKLYVAQVPRTAAEQDIRPLFEQYGNIIEVVLLKDKNTGQQQGSCFVKYATALEANKAVAALNNNYTFPGEMGPITVRYAANRERERPGIMVHEKVFVGMLNKDASMEEIEEIFSPYGVVDYIYIVRDEMKQSRGCCFVKFTHMEMARAAIEGLHGNYTMRGCDQPLIVRFAEPKKPRPGDFRSNGMYSCSNFGPDYQESGFRQTNYPSDSMYGYNQPNPMHTVQYFSSTSQSQGASLAANQEPPQFYQMPLQQMQNPETSSQSSQQITVPDLQKPVCPISENQVQEQLQQSETSGQQPPPTGSISPAVAGNSAVPTNTETTELLDCDWSEHTCPDGYKYYYNCVSCESLWDMPKEFALFEEQLNKQRQQKNPCDNIQPRSPVLSPEKITQPHDGEEQKHVLHEEPQPQLEEPSSSLPDHVEVQCQ